MEIVNKIKDIIQGKLNGAKRSNKWPAARKAHLAKYPRCAVCGGKEKVEVHHKQPFHLHPELELDPTNFITLCESKKRGINCHLLVGHVGSFKNFNPTVVEDATSWHNKLNCPNCGGPQSVYKGKMGCHDC